MKEHGTNGEETNVFLYIFSETQTRGDLISPDPNGSPACRRATCIGRQSFTITSVAR